MKKLIYLFLTVLIVACSSDDGSNDNNSNDEDNNDGDNTALACSGDNPVYLADNGVTIKACDFAIVGDTGVVNGIGYTIVDKETLRNMISNGDDVTRVCTTRIINMVSVIVGITFNQNISSWDVSNVTDMQSMFSQQENFDQPIGNWDVSNVTNMGYMFYGATSFNQPIGNWDVSNVTDMFAIFSASSTTPQNFNQNIGNWDVSNVTNMGYMFYGATSFNQPIGNWDVSNVTNMDRMFGYVYNFNQDLSSWSVDGVTNCTDFSEGATSWTLPQPNFTNCNP